ncbi:hypothetical protein SEA_ATUIN_44 [Arthrobacter phage Atuin]|nr:hypothetical protein SEA_ATUIN_143 [Arthrobacter phage Atuin]
MRFRKPYAKIEPMNIEIATNDYSFTTPEYDFIIRTNPDNPKNVFLLSDYPEAIEMAIDQIELTDAQEGEYVEDLQMETNGDEKNGYCFFVELSKPTLCLFIQSEILNFL